MPFQLPEESRHGVWIVTGAGQVADPESVGFNLLLSAVASDHRVGRQPADVGGKPAVLEMGHRCIDHRDGDFGNPGPGETLRRMAGGHMADLVTNHAGEFGFVVGECQEPACHVDVATRQGKGIDHVRVENRHREHLGGDVRCRQYPGGHHGHVGVDPGKFLVETVLVEDLRVVFGADRPFLAFADQ